MNNQESNALCAELLGIRVYEEHDGASRYWGYNEDHPVMGFSDWNPCENHNQIIEYLWPMLIKNDMRPIVDWVLCGVFIRGVGGQVSKYWDDSVARTCVDAFIEAMKGLKDDK